MTSPNSSTPLPPPHHQLHAPQFNNNNNHNSSSPSSSTTAPVSSSGFPPGSWADKIKSPFPDGLKLDPPPSPRQATPRSQPHQHQQHQQHQHQQQQQPLHPLTSSSTTRNFLKPSDPKKPFLPGQPRIPVADGDASIGRLREYLHRAHLTSEIDKLLRFMRYIFVQTPSYRHIAPLHHQKAREREVIVDEHPGLHLVWYYQVIFVQPIPAYFFSPSFWAYIEQAEPDVFQAALGFMRSYTFLIQYETDYFMACEKRLIPKLPVPISPPTKSNGSGSGSGTSGSSSNTCCCCQRTSSSSSESDSIQDGKRHPTYEEFCAFLAPFESVSDEECPRRFHYGEIRLTRINRTAFFFRLKLAYFHIYPQWGSFLQHVLAPVITVFAVATVVLNCMQVSLAAIDMAKDSEDGSWPRFIGVSKWFPIVVIIFITAVVGGGFFALVGMAINDMNFAEKTRQGKKRGDPNAGEKSSGIIW